MTLTNNATNNGAPDFTRYYPNVALARLGCEVVAASDDFFADKQRLIQPQAPVFIADKFDDHGKWMDGWETRRRRSGGNDWCVLRLGQEVEIAGVDIDTSHFTGNYPHAAALEIGTGAKDATVENIQWQPLLPQTALAGDTHHYLATAAQRGNYLRLSIYPDGGIARLRVYGRVISNITAESECDLAALTNGGRVIDVSDSHFGAPDNMLMPGRGVNMGDGWETRRLRTPGNDWAVIALGHAGTIERIVVDTAHFRGNYPAAFSLNAAYVPTLHDSACVAASMFWQPLFAKTELSANAEHEFDSGVLISEPVTHVRLNIYPDGGVSRLRLLGRAS